MSNDVPGAATDFASLALPPALSDNLATLGYHTMTPIQAESLPLILAGRDVIGRGRTGSGKTAAFGLGLLARLDVKRFCVQTLVLCPTRELADQVGEEIRRLARGCHNIKVLTLCGGVPIGPQRESLFHGAHIIVGTPGRVDDHLRRGSLSLEALNVLVLDEADRMLDMGFQDALDAIIEVTPQHRQTLLFSATWSEALAPVAGRVMKDPITIEVDTDHDEQSIHQHFYAVEDDSARLEALRRLLLKYRPTSSVVFCNTRREVQMVSDALNDHGFDAAALHGDMEQRDRDRTLILLANGSISVLVATDVAARGLDIEALDAVFNYQLAHDMETHVHRVGRTGRAGGQGAAHSLVGERERARLSLYEAQQGGSITLEALPEASVLSRTPFRPMMATLMIDAGKKQKIRPGDIVGALTGDAGIDAAQVGRIKVLERNAWVAVHRDVADAALAHLNNGRLKGRSFRARRISR
ncbi:ATP-dependent RNA helicase DbpA [Kushneria phyllosphaerae]|uniref:ATP-dependent RNA helicase DbpA n=1 Tax=Kushneria phyllosphaerae TaxID=2100822 RepID=A0A2R8CLF7_9GAMM|nr:ATP-dependent RNA helicase DbpA [Kushneria phyllosphaerae]SPJ33737.1 ATP-dependent RNA helicase DbpA [Kushneria phyllosphaerae]